MYQLLIVDDEEWIRNGIAMTIPWEDYDIKVVGEASDAIEAMDMLHKYHPDVVVTDIVMPGPSGVELCGRIQKEKPDTKVIMLSGYDQFNYAREALRRGAFDYLLKPVEEQVLIETVQEAVRLLHKERDRDNQAELYTTSLEGLKELFYMKLLEQKNTELQLNGDETTFLKITLEEDKYYSCIIWRFMENDETRLEMIRELIERAALQRFPDLQIDSLILLNQIVCICSGGRELQEDLYQLFLSLDTIRLLIPESGCCISQSCKGIAGLKSVVLENVQILANQFQIRGVKKSQDLKMAQKEGLHACRDYIQVFCESAQPERQDLEAFSEEFVSDIIKQVPGIGKAELGSILFQVMSDVASRYHKEGSLTEIPVTENNEAVAWVFRLRNISEAAEGLVAFFSYLHDYVACKDQVTRNHLIEESIKYIKDNFARDLSADEMSEYLHISKAYFSQLFSKEIGYTFTKYLTNCRIEHAKNLLTETNDRIYEVAEASGYGDVKYFLKVFKKMTGVSPQAYRERRLHSYQSNSQA